MILDEERVYLGTKAFFKNNDFIILAGQPPRGSDSFPVIEIKDSNNTDKGSKNSFKPDLVAYKDNCFYIVECKPEYNNDDYLKLKSILESDERLESFFSELNQRNLLRRNNIHTSIDDFKLNVYGVLSYSSNIIINDIYHIKIINWTIGSVNTNIPI